MAGRPLELARRRFLSQASLAAVSALLPRAAGAAPSSRSLAIVNTHTDEHLSVVYWADGRYEPGALQDLDRLLRDVFTGEVKPIDPKLLDLLCDLRSTWGTAAPFHLICGYRCPATNERLRQQSGGVARHSLHMEGRAADLRLPGVGLAALRESALQLRRGGVGYYPSSDFIHVDTGAVRTW